MDKILLIYFILFHFAFAADPNDENNKQRDTKHYVSKKSLGRIGDNPYPNNVHTCEYFLKIVFTNSFPKLPVPRVM